MLFFFAFLESSEDGHLRAAILAVGERIVVDKLGGWRLAVAARFAASAVGHFEVDRRWRRAGKWASVRRWSDLLRVVANEAVSSSTGSARPEVVRVDHDGVHGAAENRAAAYRLPAIENWFSYSAFGVTLSFNPGIRVLFVTSSCSWTELTSFGIEEL